MYVVQKGEYCKKPRTKDKNRIMFVEIKNNIFHTRDVQQDRCTQTLSSHLLLVQQGLALEHSAPSSTF